MPAGFSSQCKSCVSPNRLQLEAWHKEGKSSREISLRLKEAGEKISQPALDHHFAAHYDVTTEAQEKYAQSQINLEAEAGERVEEIQALDNLVAGKIKLHRKLEAILTGFISVIKIDENTAPEDIKDITLPHLPQAYVNLYNGLSAEIRQALKTKQELLGEDPGSKKAGALESWIDLMMEDEGAAESGAGTQ